MLVLERRVGESILIGPNVRVTVAKICDGAVRLGIEAPKDVPVDREEVRRAKEEGR